jgi:hypothetical protein
MEQGEFLDAHAALRRFEDGPLPPPAALWRLGRRLGELNHPKRARLALELFLELYPNHEDRAEVMQDLAHTLAALGKRRKAVSLAEQARRAASATA